MIRQIQLACLFALLVVFTGCEPPPPVNTGSLYLDNISDQPMVVSIDGNEMATVAAGETDNFTVPLGEHVVSVAQAGETTFEQMHNFEYAVPRTQPCFILNTDDDLRYCRTVIVYGNDDLSQSMASGLTSMIAKAASRKAVGDDPEAQKKWIEEQTRKQEFKQVMNQMSVFGEESISRFGRCTYFLTPLPSVVVGSKYSRSERRSVVVRIPAGMYNEIDALSKLEMPTEDDLDRAYALKQQVVRIVDNLDNLENSAVMAH